MKKLLILIFISMLTFSQAKMIDGIACVVNGECITVAEIRAIQAQYSIPKKEALNLLIQDRLQKSAMKDIVIDEKVIDHKVSTIAKQNKITVSKMQKILKEQGVSWEKYRSTIRNALKKEKFFQEHIASTIPTPSEDELKLYYKNHKQQFTTPSTLKLIEYSATSKQKLKDFLRTKNTKKVTSKKVTKLTKNLNPTLLSAILQTQNGSYTHIFNAGDIYISYKVLSKSGKSAMPFESARGMIIGKWRQQQQEKSVKDYFEKLKTNADVQYIKR